MDIKDKRIDALKSALVKVCDVAEELCTELEGDGYAAEFEEIIEKVRDNISSTDDSFYD